MFRAGVKRAFLQVLICPAYLLIETGVNEEQGIYGRNEQEIYVTMRHSVEKPNSVAPILEAMTQVFGPQLTS